MERRVLREGPLRHRCAEPAVPRVRGAPGRPRGPRLQHRWSRRRRGALMRELSAQLEAHLQSDVTSLAYCWLVEKNNGEVLRGTTHDQPLTISSGIYAGTYSPRTAVFATDVVKKSDGAVSNMEVEGALRVDALIGDLRVEEIE